LDAVPFNVLIEPEHLPRKEDFIERRQAVNVEIVPGCAIGNVAALETVRRRDKAGD